MIIQSQIQLGDFVLECDCFGKHILQILLRSEQNYLNKQAQQGALTDLRGGLRFRGASYGWIYSLFNVFDRKLFLFRLAKFIDFLWKLNLK